MPQGSGGRDKTWGDGWRICSTCHIKKESSEFSLSSHAKDNRQSKCQLCDRDARRFAKYGIGLVEFNRMLEEQGGHCLFCPATEYSPGKRLGIDHDRKCCPGNYSCGACIRALLCRRCNTVLGQVNDDPILLRSMARFLERM